jgi:hypothetical protein
MVSNMSVNTVVKLKKKYFLNGLGWVYSPPKHLKVDVSDVVYVEDSNEEHIVTGIEKNGDGNIIGVYVKPKKELFKRKEEK